MAKQQWLVRKARINGHPAIQLGQINSPDVELCLAGHWGEVWQNGDNFKAWFNYVGVQRMNRLNGTKLAPLGKGEEYQYRFGPEQLEGVLKAIEYVYYRPNQARLANNR